MWFKSSTWSQGYNNVVPDSKVSTSSRERRQQVIAMRLSRIHSGGVWDTYTLAQDINALV
jgi:hypothetical protein